MTKSEYQFYLQSPHWIQLAEKTRRQRKRCTDCGLGRSWARLLTGQVLNVHHLPSGYEHLGAELADDLVLLCWVCHAKRHGLSADYSLYQAVVGGRFGDRWKMPEAGEPHIRRCDLCASATGPRYYDMAERDRYWKEWICYECLRSAA